METEDDDGWRESGLALRVSRRRDLVQRRWALRRSETERMESARRRHAEGDMSGFMAELAGACEAGKLVIEAQEAGMGVWSW